MLTLLNKSNFLALLIGASTLQPALAGPDDGFKVLAGLGYFHDNNLFRLPDGHPGFGGQRGDAARQAQLALMFDKRYSLQTISAQASLTKVKFDRFGQLDYDAEDARFHWDWQIGSRFGGKLGASHAQTLAPYTDFRSDQRNLRKQRRQLAEGGWRMHPRWRARAGFSSDKYTYDLPLQRVNNRTEDSHEAGIDYLPKSGNTIGLVARRIKGRYQNRRPFGAAALDDSFDQDELKARVDWRGSGSTSVQALAGYARREHPALAGREASGFNGRVTAFHEPRGGLRYTAAVWREFSAIESNVVSDSLNKGASVGARYAATDKLRAEASLSYEKRGYHARAALNQAQDLDDSLKTAQLAATWTPRRALELSTVLARQSRSGSPFLGLGNFRANTVYLNANVRF
jgi:exopolysaccharide biosynthesis operon protein EpsL